MLNRIVSTSPLILFAALCVPAADGAAVNLSGVPDFSQHADGAWRNYCMPTNGANMAYYFAQTYPSLGGPLPPDPLADVQATSVIGMDLAVRMGTTNSGGTTAAGAVAGLDSYLEDTWDLTPGGADWDTFYRDAAAEGGTAFWQNIQNDISNMSGVILIIGWDPNALPTAEGYDLPDGYDGSTGLNAAIGHAVTMTGFSTIGGASLSVNDPANNSGAHNWAGENASFGVNVRASDLELLSPMGGTTAYVVGAVVTNIVPAPAPVFLFGMMCAAGARRRGGRAG
ncbi:MAG TPA: hypothetical protein ENK11_05210 [Phycisphaerales bacterium]|nr:hypothetical protein [Phycisphaerales bacterium]